MSDVVAAANAAYRRRQTLIERAVKAARLLWSTIDPQRIGASWAAGPRPRAVAMLTAAQQQAAADAGAAVEQMAAAQGLADDVAGELAPAAFAGVASDGRSLDSLLTFAVSVALHRIVLGGTAPQGLAAGGRWLEQVVMTQVSDAHRAATQAATTAHRDLAGWTRMAHAPCCSRCAILSGRWYRYSDGFLRHPRCDCTHVPTPRGALDGDERVLTAESYFESLSTEMQHRIFTVDGAQAIRDGADIAQVVNARRGMYTAGSSGRGVVATRMNAARGRIRLMPEQIYRQASSRTDAIKLLQDNGYILGRSVRRGDLAPRLPALRPPDPPRDLGSGRGRGGDRRPSVGDTIPTSPSSAELDRVEIALKSVVDRQFGPLRLEAVIDRDMTRDAGGDELFWDGALYSDSGEVAGEVQRHFAREVDGTLTVDHDLLDLRPQFRRQGFSGAFRRFMEQWYRESGVDAIYLHAALEDGGYVWARAGYTWRNAAAPFLDRPSGVANRLKAAIDRGQGSASERAAARRMLERLRDEPFDSPSYPTPLDVAMIGWSEGRETWLGSAVMRGSDWLAVKYLR